MEWWERRRPRRYRDQSPRQLQSCCCHCSPGRSSWPSVWPKNAGYCWCLQTARACLPANRPWDPWRHAPKGHKLVQASWSSTGKAHRVWREGSCEPAGAANISPPINARQRRPDHWPPPKCWLLAPRNGWHWVISDLIWNVKLLTSNKYSFSLSSFDRIPYLVGAFFPEIVIYSVVRLEILVTECLSQPSAKCTLSSLVSRKNWTLQCPFAFYCWQSTMF